jgi:hypothetical protein
MQRTLAEITADDDVLATLADVRATLASGPPTPVPSAAKR